MRPAAAAAPLPCWTCGRATSTRVDCTAAGCRQFARPCHCAAVVREARAVARTGLCAFCGGRQARHLERDFLEARARQAGARTAPRAKTRTETRP